MPSRSTSASLEARALPPCTSTGNLVRHARRRRAHVTGDNRRLGAHRGPRAGGSIASRVGRVLVALDDTSGRGKSASQWSSRIAANLDPAVGPSRTAGSRARIRAGRRRAWAGTRACRRPAAACRTRRRSRRPSGSSTAPGPPPVVALGGRARRARRRLTASRWPRRTCRSGSRGGSWPWGTAPALVLEPRPTPGNSGVEARRSATSGPSSPYAYVLQ